MLFGSLDVYRDIDSRAAALNMAIDEALLETATAPTIRFYRWDHPALSFGYFGKFDQVANEPRDIVRRWTGGGIVFHGADLTYALIVPATNAAFAESSMSIYEKTHAAVREALAKSGNDVRLADSAAPKISESCFANAVRADVLSNGTKVAGAAQRRTRRGLLQQGSIQGVELPAGFESDLATHLSTICREQAIGDAVLQRAERIAAEKYATPAWLRRR
jgi:lipoyl(octanoyl) transferase